jgi:hypothetical protein
MSVWIVPICAAQHKKRAPLRRRTSVETNDAGPLLRLLLKEAAGDAIKQYYYKSKSRTTILMFSDKARGLDEAIPVVRSLGPREKAGAISG